MLVGDDHQYNLHSLMEISVTDSFFGLDNVTRNCQTIETFDDCKTRLYLETMREKCRCLPLSVRLSEKVKRCNLNKHCEASSCQLRKVDKSKP